MVVHISKHFHWRCWWKQYLYVSLWWNSNGKPPKWNQCACCATHNTAILHLLHFIMTHTRYRFMQNNIKRYQNTWKGHQKASIFISKQYQNNSINPASVSVTRSKGQPLIGSLVIIICFLLELSTCGIIQNLTDGCFLCKMWRCCWTRWFSLHPWFFNSWTVQHKHKQ